MSDLIARYCPRCKEMQHLYFGPPAADGKRPFYCKVCNLAFGNEPKEDTRGPRYPEH